MVIFYGDFCEEFVWICFSMLILVAGAKGEEQMSNCLGVERLNTGQF